MLDRASTNIPPVLSNGRFGPSQWAAADRMPYLSPIGGSCIMSISQFLALSRWLLYGLSSLLPLQRHLKQQQVLHMCPGLLAALGTSTGSLLLCMGVPRPPNPTCNQAEPSIYKVSTSNEHLRAGIEVARWLDIEHVLALHSTLPQSWRSVKRMRLPPCFQLHRSCICGSPHAATVISNRTNMPECNPTQLMLTCPELRILVTFQTHSK